MRKTNVPNNLLCKDHPNHENHAAIKHSENN